MTDGHSWGSALTGEQQGSRASETEAAMRTDGGEYGRRQDSLAARAQTAVVTRDGGDGTGGRVGGEERAWHRATVGQASKEARQAQRERNAQRDCSSGVYK